MIHDLKVPPAFKMKKATSEQENRRGAADAWPAPLSARRETLGAPGDRQRATVPSGSKSPSSRGQVNSPTRKRTGAGVTRPPGQRIKGDRELIIKRKLAADAANATSPRGKNDTEGDPDAPKPARDAWPFEDHDGGDGSDLFKPWDAEGDELTHNDFTQRTDLEVYGLDHDDNEASHSPLDLTAVYPHSTAIQKRYTARGAAGKQVPPPSIETLKKRVQQKRDLEAEEERVRRLHADPTVAAQTDTQWHNLMQALNDMNKTPEQRKTSQSAVLPVRSPLQGELVRKASASASPVNSDAAKGVTKTPAMRRQTKAPQVITTPRGRSVKAAPPTRSFTISEGPLFRREPTLTNTSRRSNASPTSPGSSARRQSPYKRRDTSPRALLSGGSGGMRRAPYTSHSPSPTHGEHERKPTTVAGAARMMRLKAQHAELLAVLENRRSRGVIPDDELLTLCEITLTTVADAMDVVVH